MTRKQQLNVALDPDIRAKLEKLAEERGVSIADEIRLRLARSLADLEAFDEDTRVVAAGVQELARRIERQGANGLAWHEHAKAREALIEAITTLLMSRQIAESDPALFEDEPKTLGRAVAYGLLESWRENRELLDELGAPNADGWGELILKTGARERKPEKPQRGRKK